MEEERSEVCEGEGVRGRGFSNSVAGYAAVYKNYLHHSSCTYYQYRV